MAERHRLRTAEPRQPADAAREDPRSAIRSATTPTSRTACAASIPCPTGTSRTRSRRSASRSIRARSIRPSSSARCCRTRTDFITYSEGCNDDVNKFVWSGARLGSGGGRRRTILREYSRYFIGDRYTRHVRAGPAGARAQLARSAGRRTRRSTRRSSSSRRWSGDATPRDLLNWRFQQALYRAYYDAYVRSRLLHETALEERALARCAPRARSGHAAGDRAKPLEILGRGR